MSPSPQQIVVLGMGVSGEAAGRLLAREGHRLTFWDRGDGPGLQARAASWRAQGATVHLGGGMPPRTSFDLAVTSPGVPASDPWIGALQDAGTPIECELELGWSRRRCPVIAVTGTNGKSTTVKALCHVLQRAGLVARPAGNYGPPVCGEVEREADWLVVEASSFQLEWVREFRPEVGILLNLQANHLDRHGTMDRYGRLKAGLFARTAGDDLCLVHEDLRERAMAWSGGRGQWRTLGTSSDADFRYVDGRIETGGTVWGDLRGTWFDTPVLGPAAAAILAAAEFAGVDPARAASELARFEPLPHRMQVLGCWDGVTYIDDSKATSLAALRAAVRSAAGPVRLLAGGIAKEPDLAAVASELGERVAAAYLLGRDAESLAAAWQNDVPCEVAGTLERAVSRAMEDARPGDTVLLSPGCASFDQFAGYTERGEHFANLVLKQAGTSPQNTIEYAAKPMDNRNASGTMRLC